MSWENPIVTRNSLLSRLKDREDQESWREFFETYWRLIYNVARKAGLSDSEAEDAVQATVVTVARNIDQFKKGPNNGTFKGWLLKTTRWRIADQFRKRLPLADHAEGENDAQFAEQTIEQVPDPASIDLQEILETEWEVHLAEVAMERVRHKVDPDVYQMFDLHAVQGWTAQKVADRFEVPLSRVYAAKYKTSELIKKEVARLKDDH